MRRIVLKDKELEPVTMADITSLASDSEIPVYAVSPTENNSFILGYNGSSITHTELGTSIYTQAGENAVLWTKLNQLDSSYNLFLRKYDNDVVLVADYQSTLNFIPPSNVHKVLLKQGNYYMGVNGTSLTTTNNASTAATNETYHWDLLIDGVANASIFGVKIYNRSTKGYLKIGRTTTTTTTTTTYVDFYNGNSFYLLMQSEYAGSNNALHITNGSISTLKANGQNKIRGCEWTIISLETSYTNGDSAGWKCPLAFNISSGNTQSGLLAGYNVPFLRFEQEGGYLSHGTSYSSGVSFSTQGTSTNAEWVLFKRNYVNITIRCIRIDSGLEFEFATIQSTMEIGKTPMEQGIISSLDILGNRPYVEYAWYKSGEVWILDTSQSVDLTTPISGNQTEINLYFEHQDMIM